MKKQTEEEQRNEDTKEQREADKGGEREREKLMRGRKKNLIQFYECKKCRVSQPTFLACAAASSDR